MDLMQIYLHTHTHTHTCTKLITCHLCNQVVSWCGWLWQRMRDQCTVTQPLPSPTVSMPRFSSFSSPFVNFTCCICPRMKNQRFMPVSPLSPDCSLCVPVVSPPFEDYPFCSCGKSSLSWLSILFQFNQFSLKNLNHPTRGNFVVMW